MHPPPKESAQEAAPYSEEQRNGPQGNALYLDTSRTGGRPQQMRVALLATAFLGACGGARSLPERAGSVPRSSGKRSPRNRTRRPEPKRRGMPSDSASSVVIVTSRVE